MVYKWVLFRRCHGLPSTNDHFVCTFPFVTNIRSVNIFCPITFICCHLSIYGRFYSWKSVLLTLSLSSHHCSRWINNMRFYDDRFWHKNEAMTRIKVVNAWVLLLKEDITHNKSSRILHLRLCVLNGVEKSSTIFIHIFNECIKRSTRPSKQIKK